MSNIFLLSSVPLATLDIAAIANMVPGCTRLFLVNKSCDYEETLHDKITAMIMFT